MKTEAASIAVQPQKEPKTGSAAESGTDLVAMARGDAQAFDRLMQVHERQVLATAWRLLGRQEDAQDAAQEVFLRLYRFLDRFDVDRPLSPWLYRMTVNVCRDLGRRRQARRAVSLDALEESRPLASEDPATDPDAALSLSQEKRIIEAALATLAEKERTAVVLRDVQGLTTAETAAALGSSEVTVRSQICRARLKIKKFRDRQLKRRL